MALWLASGWIGLLLGLTLASLSLPLPDPAAMDLLSVGAGPSSAHWLGTDGFGRDIFSRLAHGARISLFVGLAAPALGLVLGGGLGLLAGYRRGWVEAIVLLLIDTLLAFPGLVLALAIMAYLGQTLGNVTLALGILTLPAFARVARANTLSIAQRDFVLAARTLGAGPGRILWRHVLPNVIPPLSAYALLMVALLIAAEGTLSFLGLGVPQPTPSWGNMIADGRDYLLNKPHICLIPAAAIFLTVLSCNVLSEALRQRW